MVDVVYVIGIVVLIVILVGAAWWYLSRQTDIRRGQGDDRENRPHGDEQHDFHGSTGRHSPVTTSRFNQTDLRHQYKGLGIEAITTRLSKLERTVQYLQEDLINLHAERGLHDSASRIGERDENRFSTDDRSTRKPLGASSGTEDTLGIACDAYRRLSTEGLRGLPIEPLFVLLDIESTARWSAIGEAKRHFTQSDNKQSAFVVFPESPGAGWIFPNPRISFTEAMKYVFPDLSYETFEDSKNSVDPRRVLATSDGVWETVSD